MQLNRSSRPEGHVRICAPLCAKTIAELELLSSEAAAVADLIELRLDCLDEVEFANSTQLINRLAAGLPLPLIITLRPSEQGGLRDISIADRRKFWEDVSKPAGAWFDIERDLCESSLPVDWSRVICSQHDFKDVPKNLDDIYEEMSRTPAAILKIAVRASDTVDCLPIFRILERARNEGREMIAIAMGVPGIATRVLGPSRGSYLTYAALSHGSGTAPGQLTISQLNSIYRIKEIDSTTQIHGLVGSPVTHSVSPHLHNAGFASESLNAVYLPFEVHDLAGFFGRMVHPRTREIDWPLRGLSITAPHKTAVMDHLDWIDAKAKEIGAVNTVVVESDRLMGFNTDAPGLLEPLRKKIVSFAGLRVAIIGAGGAARAAAWALDRERASVSIFARDPMKAQESMSDLNILCLPLDTARFERYELVINATPLGSLGQLAELSPLTEQQLAGARLVYDLVYNPSETRLLREARRAGCDTLAGLEMLIAQAVLQFKLWTGREAPSSVMRDAALQALEVQEQENSKT
jgi:3-dehydroquinate dehydratase / shikimate dehydrogenase